jgi:DNA-binding Lrp family transcriptional regulator
LAIFKNQPVSTEISVGSLDQKDKLLLSMLQSNAELSLSEIGGQLGLTRMAISNRIKRLKMAGIIEGSHYRMDPQKVGQGYLVVCQVTCEASGPEQEKVAARIAKIPGIQIVYLTFGPYDMLLIARRQDLQSAKRMLYDVTQVPGIKNTLTTIPHTVVKESLEVDLGVWPRPNP